MPNSPEGRAVRSRRIGKPDQKLGPGGQILRLEGGFQIRHKGMNQPGAQAFLFADETVCEKSFAVIANGKHQ